MGENPNKDVILFDPILFSIAGWNGSFDKNEIKRFCLTVFSKDDLKAAMKIISDTDTLSGVRPSTNHQKPELCFDSIWNNMEYLDQAGHMPVYAVKSLSVEKLPMASPVERDGIPHGRISALEKAVGLLITNNKELVDKVDLINKVQPTYSRAAAVHLEPLVQPLSVQSQVQGNLSLPPPMQSRPPPLKLRQPQYAAVQSHKMPNPSHTNVAAQNAQSNSVDALDSGEWTTTRKRRPKVIRGTAPVSNSNAPNMRVGWTPAPRDIFVYHTNHLTTTEDISDLMIDQSKVTPMNVEKRSKEYAYFGSFRVTVRRDDFDQAMKAEHWPAGWSIREYYVSRERREVERLERAGAMTDGNDHMNTQLITHVQSSVTNAEPKPVEGNMIGQTTIQNNNGVKST